MSKTLIVEDNSTFRQSLKELLGTRFPTMDVKEAADGEEALQKITDHVPEIVFMDIKLPGENGLQITKKVKAKYPEIIVIILTYYDLPEHREAALLTGTPRSCVAMWSGPFPLKGHLNPGGCAVGPIHTIRERP
jgi:CheY-like chemotaxis protein